MKKLKDLILDNLEVSVSRFAKEVGVGKTTIDNILYDKNKYGASLITRKKICKYFNVDWHEFM